MKPVKILLVCGSRFALPSMRDMVMSRQLAVVVIPAHCEDFLLEVRQLLQPTGIPVMTTDKKNSDQVLRQAIQQHGVTIALMMTYSYKISKQVFELPEKGFYNFHPGPLPAYRGADPVFRQIANQEKHAGVTVHLLDEGMDTGPVVIGELTKIDNSDTYGMVHARLGELASRLCGVLIKMAALDIDIPSRPQDATKAAYYPRQVSKDIVVQWNEMAAAGIVALINACNPWNKGAVAMLNNKIIRLLRAVEDNGYDYGGATPGTIVHIDEDFLYVAVKPAGVLKVSHVYTDEGFLVPADLLKLGLRKGVVFQSI